MAGLSLAVFGLLVVSCCAHFGFDHSDEQSLRQQNNPLLPTPGVEDKKCFTITRRRFFMTKLMKYPCSRRTEGVPVVRSFMGPFGPMCVSYIRQPVFRFFKVPQCCLGFTTDNLGRCTIRIGQNAPVEPEQPQPPRPSFPEMMAMAASMRRMMWLKAKESMARRRALFLMNMNRMKGPMMMRHNLMNRMMPPKMPRMIDIKRNQHPPTITYLQFRRPTSPPVPHPIPRPPMSGRIIKIIRNKMFPNGPMMPFMPRPLLPPNPSPFSPPQSRSIPKIVLSNRENFLPFNNKLREFHPPSTQLRVALRLSPNFLPHISSAFPQDVPETPAADDMYHNNVQDSQPFPDMPSDTFGDAHMQGAPEASMGVDLPDRPVEMPDLIVEEGPMNEGNPESCIARLESAVKTCLRQNHIDVPDVMSAFEPFNDDTSRELCVAEDEIFNCISDAVSTCVDTPEGAMARDMLHETAENVRSMCALRAASVTSDVQEQADSPSTAEKTKTEASVKVGETVATVENVDAIPTDVKPASQSEQPTVNTGEEKGSHTASFTDVLQQEMDMQDELMKEYYLPILIGAGVGFFLIVLVLSLLVCFCCKRKMKRKMKMQKETEKPPLKDGIYTIGVAPPIYEINGIPPLYYEEAKGEKITSRSPSVVEGGDSDTDGENTQM